MIRAVRRSLAVLALALGGTTGLPAQTPSPDTAKFKPYAIPESPAFTFLNATPGNVSRPTTARALAVGVLGDVMSTGEVPQGLALDVAPWSLLPGLRIPLARYQASPGLYALANTQFSLGTVRAEGDSADTDLGAGLRVTLFDGSDPMRDTSFTRRVRAGLVECLPEQPGPDGVARSEQCARELTERVRKAWLEDEGHWNDASFAVAGALGWRFVESRADESDWLGWGVWATGSLPLDWKRRPLGQVLGQLRYDTGRKGEDGLWYGARAYAGTGTMNVFGEIGRGEDETDWAGGIEFRVLGSMWLSTGLGTQATPAGDDRTVAVIANLRVDLREQPRFNLRP
jgi:hypothetical protein